MILISTVQNYTPSFRLANLFLHFIVLKLKSKLLRAARFGVFVNFFNISKMKQYFKVWLITVICAASLQSQAQVKPVVIEERLHKQYHEFVSDTSTFGQIAEINDRIEDIRKTFPGQENDADIKAMIDELKKQIPEIKNKREIGLKGLKDIEPDIKKIIIDAKGVPVVWRTPPFMPTRQYKMYQYTINTEGHIECNTSDGIIKE